MHPRAPPPVTVPDRLTSCGWEPTSPGQSIPEMADSLLVTDAQEGDTSHVSIKNMFHFELAVGSQNKAGETRKKGVAGR